MTFWLALLACRDLPPRPEDPAPEVFDAQGALSPLSPNVLAVSWEGEPGEVHFVEYGEEGALDRATPERSEPRVAVLGLASGVRYAWRAVSIGADGVRRSSPVESVEIPEVPERFAPVEVEILDRARSEIADGYLLFAVSDLQSSAFLAAGYVAVTDSQGRYVWYQALPPGHITLSPSVHPHAPEILWDDYPLLDPFDARAHRTRIDGSATVEIPLREGHHTVIAPSAEALAWIAADFREVDGESIVTDRIYEAPRPGDPPREVVNLFEDHFGGSFEDPCVHTSTPHWVGRQPNTREWTHSNSLVYEPTLDSYFLFSRWIDTLFRIDRTSGEILWKMGGKDSDFTLLDGSLPWLSAEESALWSHGHLSQAWDGGLVMFDNGDHHTPEVSSIVEIAWDESTMMVEEVFRYEHPSGLQSYMLGDARKLPRGGYLAVWSEEGRITEITPDGAEVFSLELGLGRGLGRAAFIEDLYAAAAER